GGVRHRGSVASARPARPWEGRSGWPAKGLNFADANQPKGPFRHYIEAVITPTGPKLPARKGADLDQPWHAADPIPAPDAVHSDGDSAWAMWNEVSKQHEQKFAPT